jgi:hypothetical protein
LLILAGIFFAIFAWDRLRRHWSPTLVFETDLTHWSSDEVVAEGHYVIYSTATDAQTAEVGQVAEIVYAGYLQLARRLGLEIQPHPKLKIKLFKDRREFRHCNRVRGWAEAFYRKPYCYQYYAADEPNPYHWMMHEAIHQRNAEAARLALPRWLDEGLACYLSTSRIVDGSLHLGRIDTNTYPVWWLEEIAVTGKLITDQVNGTVIPLRAIVSGRGGPDLDRQFNLYYLHWWSLMHFLMEFQDGAYRAGLSRVIAEGGGPDAFEKHIGDLETTERLWYDYVLELRRDLAGRSTPPVTLPARGTFERRSSAADGALRSSPPAFWMGRPCR